jgi:hypothetical protein
MNSFSKLVLSLAAFGSLSSAGFACDSCALFIADGADRPGWTASIAHQFTRLGTVWSGDQKLGNPVDQYIDSHATQFTAGYSHGGPWSLQFTVPYLSRSYLRPEHALIETGREEGWGDVTLATRYRLYRKVTETRSVEFAVLGGVKFATGDATHLGDEIGHHFHHHEGFPDSGVHGHDLALGTGSTDYLLGADGEWRQRRFFVRGSLQYKLRRPGAYDYRMADETVWEAGPGAYAILTHEHSLALQGLFAVEHKGLDTLAGEEQIDTGFSCHYVGARLTGTWRDSLTVTASVEVPVRRRTSETMVVPDYRWRTAATWRF